MQRRDFLKTLGAGLLTVQLPGLAYALAPAGYERLLILVELKGGNDGLNTVVPFASSDYYRLRPSLAIAREQVLQLNESSGLHPALAPLLPLWQAGQLAIVQGVGYPEPNLSHFRSIDIWDSASNSQQYLSDGWLTRLFQHYPPGDAYASDGVILGSQTLGPLAGGARAVVLTTPDSFARQARLVQSHAAGGSGALAHILKVEDDIRHAAAELGGSGGGMAAMAPAGARDEGKLPAAPGAFGQAIRTLLATLDGGARIAVARLTLTGFDTHSNQPATQARLLGELAEGLAALQQGLDARGRWRDTLLMSYAEFGRRPRQNGNNGTDHGTANAHFVLGGRVKGGLYGQAPQLADISDGNLPYAVDFRQLYATAIEQWWGKPSAAMLGNTFRPLPLLAV
ncbi:DUF1501 domain-containing protein [Vogesella sp. LIG4]|uniref:DUF1501 domain-containing protein n=1 Tax=Vogesella sp. LIG4 TaxID=1192162 RepID=UPI00081F84BC|nr:DUF1501 domain-containing protein [Vogesella sp. LIG4]SCK29281.1 Uncharacterized conserved protein, DUF1501 family [Vogesella sp. LIG4]